MAGELEMGLKLLGRHLGAGGVELGGAVEAADSRQPGEFNAVWERLGLDGKLGDGVEI